ncbi:MAG: restriction endonuclease subunit S [Gammaproteobacteria bacterium]|nr:restriction endonuclease subunit S [Gammaproteobacteria bacterium]MBU1469020.1 restriction endonuclease subunit S [Gammaproteobacteria bacterium]MBU2024301.1 restriction endonuclease subunit S [Gammaproteobacteria bacterium]MBU2238247.1 restriction endonuclease subunit S [Gammaproteobacteria bacterium]MBU2318043.1 restriction endonuclease subunit S [Gammaproteobacteria bacterium]
MVKLNKICRPKQWKTISSSNLLEYGYPVYGANGKIGFYSEYTHESPALMITCRGATCGNVNISEPKSYINGNAMVLDDLDTSSVDLNYLYYFFKKRGFNDVISGSAQPQITGQGLTKVEIPLPPLEEQKRIAAILDKADVIRRKRQQAIKLADDFLRAVFLDMFGDPVTNPKGWEVKPLSYGIDSITSGWSAKGEGYPCKEGELGVLKISAVTSGRFNSQENKFVHGDDIPDGKRLVFPKKGDLLFSRANTRELVAATCIVQDDCENAFLPDKLWNIKTDSSVLLPEFLNCLIWEPKFKETLTSQATGTSGSMLNISKGKFEATDAIFPSISIQYRFRAVYWKMQKTIISLNHFLDESEYSFSSLSQRAFSGHL